MRTKEDLFSFNDVAIFFQYLYMDENHKITFNNGITNLTLRMTDNFGIACKNESFPDLPELSYTDSSHPRQILGIIEILKEQPPVEFPDSFVNRWQEIKFITGTQLALNRK